MGRLCWWIMGLVKGIVGVGLLYGKQATCFNPGYEGDDRNPLERYTTQGCTIQFCALQSGSLDDRLTQHCPAQVSAI